MRLREARCGEAFVGLRRPRLSIAVPSRPRPWLRGRRSTWDPARRRGGRRRTARRPRVRAWSRPDRGHSARRSAPRLSRMRHAPDAFRAMASPHDSRVESQALRRSRSNRYWPSTSGAAGSGITSGATGAPGTGSTRRPRPPRLTCPPLRPALRASSAVHSWAVPFSWAARPPLLAISRCFSGDIDAKPRRSLRSFVMSALLYLPVLPLGGRHTRRSTLSQRQHNIGSGVRFGRRILYGQRRRLVERCFRRLVLVVVRLPRVRHDELKLQSPCHCLSRRQRCLLGIQACGGATLGSHLPMLQQFATEGLAASSD